MRFQIRSATTEDVEALSKLVEEFAQYLAAIEGQTTINYDVEKFLRDGFGPNPAFSGLVAETEGELIGYLLYYPGYESDYVTRILHIIDLYIREGWRHQGVGQALMAETANICRQLGGTQLVWPVWVRNKPAFAFYKNLGAKNIEEMQFMQLDV